MAFVAVVVYGISSVAALVEGSRNRMGRLVFGGSRQNIDPEDDGIIEMVLALLSQDCSEESHQKSVLYHL